MKQDPAYATGDILVLNAGSSSLKFAVFGDDLSERHNGVVTEIGGNATIKTQGVEQSVQARDHAQALALIFALPSLQDVQITAVGHRVVHGGETLTKPQRLTAQTIAAIEHAAALAPLHNPPSLLAIDAVGKLMPQTPQFCSFDTAFHMTQPSVARRYALPDEAATKGVIRYGFHGISYASVVDSLYGEAGAPAGERLLACHLGNGASLCAIVGGKAVGTTMGYSPTDGLTMGTRSGAIDPTAVLDIADRIGNAETRALLNERAGLSGLAGGTSNMATLLSDGGAEANFAIEHFCYWLLRHAGSLVSAMQGVDAIAFTGGIGENAADIRTRVADGLGWLGVRLDQKANDANARRLDAEGSAVAVWIAPAQEERRIAKDIVDSKRSAA